MITLTSFFCEIFFIFSLQLKFTCLKNFLKTHRRYLFKVLIFRYCGSLDQRQLITTAKNLAENTIHKKGAKLEEAPGHFDCLTIVYHLFQKHFAPSELTWIGDMPRRLQSLSSWKILRIDFSKTKTGDLLFLKERFFRKFVSHVGVVVEGKIFSSTAATGTSQLETLEKVWERYEQKLSLSQLLRYTDHRGEDRKRAKGTFIKV